VATPTKKATKPTVVPDPEPSEDEDDDLEELDEVEELAEASEAEAPKKSKKAKAAKPERQGLSTKDAAAQLGITPVRLRRILRSEDGGHADKEYTRYDLTQEEVDHIRELLQAGATAKAEKKPKAKKAKKVEADATEVTDELEELADLADEDSD